ncbi:MAG: type II toxin-antitoxin system RelE/ParE family toxin [Bacteroidales bacterium]|nr:type II toxin-antitoxin system RelE/ParE family toxin [Bacteroidales bacterium]
MHEKIRTVVAYKDYFKKFLLSQPEKVQNKIFKIIEIIEYQQQIPEKYIKHIEGVKGLYETRISLGSNIWRVFCFFDEGKLVILLHGFQKKTQKTPKKEIKKAVLLMEQYFIDKKEEI